MKRIFCFLLIFLLSRNVFAEMLITDFDEKVLFTDYGREIETNIKFKIKLDSPNQYYKEWKYIFDERLNVEVLEAKVIGKSFKALFKNNELVFQFDKAFNGSIFSIKFKYKIFEENIIDKYIREEMVIIPNFARGSNGSLVVIVPYNLAVYSLNRNFAKINRNVYKWKGIVPQNGFTDIFYLTLKKAKWKAEILSELKTDKNITNLEMAMPIYFKNGNNNIEKYMVETNYRKDFTKIIQSKNSLITYFQNVDGSLFQVKVSAILSNDFDNKVWIKLNPYDYLKIDNNLSNKLRELVFKIQEKDKSNELVHIKIAQWVHNNIEYDYSFLGKDMTTEEILEYKKGVCIHYAQLYNDLLRSIGIPAVMVSGISYNTEKKDFENHAWNIVYSNGDWRLIDSTWGIYSGILPVSHIFLYFENRAVINYSSRLKEKVNFTSDIKKNIKFIQGIN